jgi:hypothetical protein
MPEVDEQKGRTPDMLERELLSKSGLFDTAFYRGSIGTLRMRGSIPSIGSCLVATRMPRSMLRVILLNGFSTKFNHEPCFGMNTKTNRCGTLSR